MDLFSCLQDHITSRPQALAVADRERALSFSALIHEARCLGARLRLCAKENEPVGVMAGRGVDTVVCMLAVILSGAYYVPLDPDMPAAKREKILADTGMRVCLGLPEHRFEFSGLYLTPTDALDEECPFPAPGPEKPLYMVFTSGSTGTPKGVMKSRGAMERFVDAYTARFDLAAGEVIGNQTPFFFDASAKDLFLMLHAGLSLQILPTELFTLPPALIEYMNERRVSFISWVPTALSVVAQLKTFSFIKPAWLRKVFFVGEVMPVKHLNAWMDALPGVQFVNLYGSSEIAGVACAYEVTRRFGEDETLPLGQPLSHCRVTLMGEDGAPVTEPGRVGEIVIESPSLAEGYFHDEEKTRARFPQRDGARVFLTGDLARRTAGGDLVFVSRADFQIKHQGRRIELGEIEAAAQGLEGVERCSCVYDTAKKRIVLFCQTRENSPLDARQVKHLLKERLSAYMVPERVTLLNALPLNANGKIDRPRLNTPEYLSLR